MGDEKRPRFRLPARADKGPSGAPTNGLSLLGGTPYRVQEGAQAWNNVGVYFGEW